MQGGVGVRQTYVISRIVHGCLQQKAKDELNSAVTCVITLFVWLFFSFLFFLFMNPLLCVVRANT